MKDIMLTNFKVKGIKSLEEWVDLSFYKKSFPEVFNTKGYNVKALYGANGAGKTGIVTAARILKSIITEDDYLVSQLTQRKLSELINKKLGYLEYEVEFWVNFNLSPRKFLYTLRIGKDNSGRYAIEREKLSYSNAKSHSKKDVFPVFEVDKGELVFLFTSPIKDNQKIRERVVNRLDSSSLTATYIHRYYLLNTQQDLDMNISSLYILGISIFTYIDSEDEHDAFFLSEDIDENNILHEILKATIKGRHEYDSSLRPLHPESIEVYKSQLREFEKQVSELTAFLKIFKPELVSIDIDKSIDKDFYHCKLILVYKDYSVSPEFESTGVKKLIRLFSYFQKMVSGEIVFIDELDSNLHDVYLCALLEFLMEYGRGQLCFTTHNVGPMDVLKKNKKSIDFLSVSGQVYSWTSNGNYSPSKLYREGMISGSPFNVESFDFIKAFGNLLED